MNEKNSGLHVKDNRMFNADGSLREEAVPSNEATDKTATTKNTVPPETNLPPREEQHDSKSFAPSNTAIDFSTFVLSFATQAQISMGIIPNPMTETIEKDLRHAKQTIDIIGMLEEKTRSNLSPEESGLLKQVLFQLRMQFVEINKSQK